jgi:hypothetical protein
MQNVTEKELDDARKVFVDNWTEITEHPNFIKVIKGVEKDSAIERFKIVRLLLMKSPATLNDLYEQLKGKYYFSDMQDLEGLLVWLVNKNKAIKNGDQYIWVGKG